MLMGREGCELELECHSESSPLYCTSSRVQHLRHGAAHRESLRKKGDRVRTGGASFAGKSCRARDCHLSSWTGPSQDGSVLNMDANFCGKPACAAVCSLGCVPKSRNLLTPFCVSQEVATGKSWRPWKVRFLEVPKRRKGERHHHLSLAQCKGGTRTCFSPGKFCFMLALRSTCCTNDKCLGLCVCTSQCLNTLQDAPTAPVSDLSTDTVQIPLSATQFVKPGSLC